MRRLEKIIIFFHKCDMCCIFVPLFNNNTYFLGILNSIGWVLVRLKAKWNGSADTLITLLLWVIFYSSLWFLPFCDHFYKPCPKGEGPTSITVFSDCLYFCPVKAER